MSWILKNEWDFRKKRQTWGGGSMIRGRGSTRGRTDRRSVGQVWKPRTGLAGVKVTGSKAGNRG